MRAIRKIFAMLAIIACFVSVSLPTFVGAANSICPDGVTSDVCGDDRTIESVIKVGVDTLMFAIGAVSVVIIIIAGIRMAASSGNAESVKKARNSILFAAIGIIVAISGYAIVRFVFDQATQI